MSSIFYDAEVRIDKIIRRIWSV